MLTQTPKGTKDILPMESHKWQYVESQIAKVCANFGYKEIRTPVFEHTELFQRGVGDTTDIVQKEMYTFLDKGNRSISLRPEGTAGVVRSYIENGMSSLPQPVKLYYNITAYRYEKMAKGRYREFHQFGVETFGSKGPSIDVEIISLIKQLFDSLGLKDVGLNINSIGCPVCRKEYNQKLMDYFRPHLDELCGLCNNRFERNPLRIIDCKEDKCKTITAGAPAILDNLCEECRVHFEGLKKGLDNLGIAYNVDKNIVRGLDYYTKTVFEFISENVGTQGTICGGGRYDGLVGACGGPSTPAVGFAIGIERLLMEMESQGVYIPPQKEIEIYIAAIGEAADTFAEKLVYDLRARQIPAEKDLLQKSLKAQMKYADKIGAKFTVVLGEDEVNNNRAVLKNMKTGEQSEISLDKIHEEIINRR